MMFTRREFLAGGLLAFTLRSEFSETEGASTEPEGITIPGGDGVPLDSVRVVALDRNGELVAIAGAASDPRRTGYRIEIWSTNPVRRLRVLRGHREPIRDLRFASPSVLISTAEGQPGETIVWDWSTGAVRHRIGYGGPSLAVSPRGGQIHVPVPDRRQILTFDIKTGQEVRRSDELRFPVVSDPLGEFVLSRSSETDPRVWAYDGLSGETLGRFREGEQRPVSSNAMALSPDGGTIAATNDSGGITLYDVLTETKVRSFDLPSTRVLRLAFSSDGRYLLAGDVKGTARVWTVMPGKPVGNWTSHRGPVPAACWSADGQWIATGSVDRTVRLQKFHGTTQASGTEPDENEVLALWEALTSENAAVAYSAMGTIEDHFESVFPIVEGLLTDFLVPPEVEAIRKLIADLQHRSDLKRHAATEKLRRYRVVGRDLMIAELRRTRSAEVRYRLRRILITGPETPRFTPGDRRRFARLMQVAQRVRRPETIAALDVMVANLTDDELLRQTKHARRRAIALQSS